MNKKYDEQVLLLLDVLPVLNDFPEFALKGGTAINLFYRPMPRRSVDLDLIFLPLMGRDETLNRISSRLDALGQRIEKQISHAVIRKQSTTKIILGQDLTIKLDVFRNPATIRIEPNLVVRGSVFPPAVRELCKVAQSVFGKYTTALCASFEDTYGGKICAALDRQHPRDFFDIKLLLDNEGISPRLIEAFLLYLCSHNRPLSEILNPRFNKNFFATFDQEFEGMTTDLVTADSLVAAFEQLKKELFNTLDRRHRDFVIGFSDAKPDWSLVPEISHVQDFPSIKWKLMNIEKMDRQKRQQEKASLEKLLM